MRSVVLLICGLLASVSQINAGEIQHADHPIANSYIIFFKNEAVKSGDAPTAPGLSVRQLLDDVALVHGAQVHRNFGRALPGGVLELTEAQARRLAADPRVARVKEEGIIEGFATQATWAAWGLDRIDERDRPTNHHYTYTKTGAGVNIYILDSGVTSTSELGSRRVNTYSTVRDASGNPLYGDPTGHGTNVAIKAAGATYGVAKGATVRVVRIQTVACPPPGSGGREIPAFASTCFTEGAVFEALAWVTSNRIKPAVANLSFGSSSNQDLDNAVAGLVASGVTVVAAAGNSGISACNVSPARLSQVITVGASDYSDARASFAVGASNIGSCVNLFAPGKDLCVSSDCNANTSVDGTSFAAPMVAGLAAQYLQQSPSASPATVKSYVENNSTTGRLTNLGTGSPNRLLFVPPGGTEIDNPPTGDFTYSCSGRTCTFTSTTSDDFSVSSCNYTWWESEWSGHNFGSCAPSVYTFPSSGPQNVQLWIFDDGGQLTIVSKTVNVP